MSSSKLAKISKQHEKTWCDLHMRLISVSFSFEDVFTDRVYEFITNKATALSTSIGYMQGRNLSDNWGGGVYSYSCVMPDGFLLKSTQI